MKIVLPDALHARPANLLVRLASQHAPRVELRRCGRSADARRIMDVLALGAAKGEEIEIVAEGDGADLALAALAELFARNFDADLVPERGSGAVEGIAIGVAVVVAKPEGSARARGTNDEEIARLAEAQRRARASLEAVIALLPEHERPLFEPERAIVDELASRVAARVRAGEGIEEALDAETANAATDLILDARARLLDALLDADAHGDAVARACGAGEEVVVVAEALTPSLVAALPACVRGIVAAEDEPDTRVDRVGAAPVSGVARTSHAAILARGRELPLAFVPPHVALAIGEGDRVVVDTTIAPARVWVAPSDALLEDARAGGARHAEARAATAGDAARVAGALGVELLVNVGSLHDRVPPGAGGVGLLRTELLFAGRTRAPGEEEQLAALLAVARAASGRPVTARLFDAGGDKPLAWLPSTGDDARGVALLLAHPAVLDAQCGAIARAAESAPVRVLIPLVRSAADVDAVRARARGVPVGAMIETREAALDAEAIAAASDFVSIGTNDLAASVLGAGSAHARGDATRALDPRVLALVDRVVGASHARGRRVTVCGEVAADARGARVLVGLGVDGLSVAPPRLADVVAALRDASRESCIDAARATLEDARRT